MSRILVSGSLAYDRIMDFDGLFAEHILPGKMHALSVSFLVQSLRESFGGCAGNIAYTLSLLDEHPTVIGTAGNDFETYEAWLRTHGIDTSLIQKKSGVRTAFANIMTDKANSQITAFYPGAMQFPYPVETVPYADGALIIISPSNPETMRALPSLCRKSDASFIFDPGQQIPMLAGEDLKDGIEGAKALIVNDYELELVMKKTEWSEEDILAHAEMLVVTLGEKGSRIRTKSETLLIPAAKPQAVVDPTGAGDAYRAGFLAGLKKDFPLQTCGRMGSVAACYTIETAGTQEHSFTREAFAERYRENFNESLTL